MKPTAFVLVALVAACEFTNPWSSRTPVDAPKGAAVGEGSWWEIRCHRDDDGCLRQAQHACPQGYDVKERDKKKYLLIQCQGIGAKREYVEERPGAF